MFNMIELQGFVKSLNFLKKSENSKTSFPVVEKVWRIQVNSGKLQTVRCSFGFLSSKTATLVYLLIQFLINLISSQLQKNIQSQNQKFHTSLMSALHCGLFYVYRSSWENLDSWVCQSSSVYRVFDVASRNVYEPWIESNSKNPSSFNITRPVSKTETRHFSIASRYGTKALD